MSAEDHRGGSCQWKFTYTMSTNINMMSVIREPELARRLEKLTGEEASACIPRYRSLATGLTRGHEFRDALRRFAALADRRRLLAVRLLDKHPELCACEIQAALGLSHPAVSYHMRILVQAGIVETERRGKWIHYRLSPAARGIFE